MKILKSDSELRIIEKYAYVPKELLNGDRIFMKKYYELQRKSYWGLGKWIYEEDSLNPHEWDFKWSEEYLASWKKPIK